MVTSGSGSVSFADMSCTLQRPTSDQEHFPQSYFWCTLSSHVHLFVASCIHCFSTTGGTRVPRPLRPYMHDVKPSDFQQFSNWELCRAPLATSKSYYFATTTLGTLVSPRLPIGAPRKPASPYWTGVLALAFLPTHSLVAQSFSKAIWCVLSPKAVHHSTLYLTLLPL